MEKVEIKIKPLSVNLAWKGRRYKTQNYVQYERDVYYLLPKQVNITNKLYIDLGFSSNASDIDNPIKPFLDILQKKYQFNDNKIEILHIEKHTVEKGEEYIKFWFM